MHTYYMKKPHDAIIKELKNATTIQVNVKTNAKENKIEKNNEKYTLYIKAKPENNKANEEIEKYLSKITGKSAKIIKGKTQIKKTIKLN